jgi:hypothetical protein
MIVYQQDAPVTQNCDVRFPINWSILPVPIPLDGGFNGI